MQDASERKPERLFCFCLFLYERTCGKNITGFLTVQEKLVQILESEQQNTELKKLVTRRYTVYYNFTFPVEIKFYLHLIFDT